jgi:hypothetical protein
MQHLSPLWAQLCVDIALSITLGKSLGAHDQ